MDPNRDWHRLWELFEHGIALEAPSRASWLASLAGADAALAPELDALITAHHRGDTPLDRTPQATTRTEPPTQLGPYRVLRELGRGGMGEVYLAERSDGVHDAKVAVKLVSGTAFDPRATMRFARERRILARLAHPGIARMLDGGTTPDGQPWLAMEYVDGVAIDAYCERHGLGTAQRVALARDVCAAIAYAHRNLVVHRDLKPANILVRADGSAAVLDFGVAKLIDHPGDGDATRVEVAATPRYAAPEQLRGEPVTTAADVYALGATLYRLLTGSPPVPVDDVDWATLRTRVESHVPTPPSRAASPGARIDADLDRVVLKALAKSPDERYADAQSFGDDLTRWLEHRPVRARPASPLYGAWKFARRHRAGVAVAVLALAVIATLAVRLVAESRATVAALAASELERDRNERTAQFLAGLFRAADPTRRGGDRPDVRDLLREGAARLDADASLDPALRARLTLALADVHRNLGLYDDALAYAAKAREAAPDAATRRDAELITAELHELRGEHQLAHTQLTTLHTPCAAFGAAPGAVGAASASTGPQPESSTPLQCAAITLALARTAQSLARYPEAEAHYHTALATREARLGPAHPDTIAVLMRQAGLAWSRGKYDDAERVYRDVHDRRRATLPPDHPDLAQSLDALGLVQHRVGRYDEAQASYAGALAIRRRALGPQHRDIAESLSNLGSLHYDAGRAEQATAPLVEALAMQRVLLPPRSPLIAKTLNNLGLAHQAQQRYPDARVAFEEALAINRRAFGEIHPHVAGNLNNLGLVQLESGDPAAAIPLLDQALALGERLFGLDHASLGFALTNLGRAHAALGHDAYARRAFDRALTIRRATLEPHHPALAETLFRYGEFECTRGAVAPGLAHLEAALAIRTTKLAPESPTLAATRTTLTTCKNRDAHH